MKYDYGKYTRVEVKAWLEKQFSYIDNIVNTEHQSLYFMNTLLEHIKSELGKEMKKSTILDWGCATGVSLVKLKEFCGHNDIYGIDISEAAVNYGKKVHNVNITTKEIDENYDFIITSNCLEHIKNYKEVMKFHASHCNKGYIVMIPFEGAIKDNSIGDHIVSFNNKNIPRDLNNLELKKGIIVDFRGNGVWPGYQIILIYKKKDAL